MPRDKIPFYRNMWFWIVVSILVITSAAGASNLNFKNNNAIQQNEPVQANQDPEDINAMTQSQQVQTRSRNNETFKQAIATGKIFEAEPGKYYPHKKLVALKNKDFALQVDDFSAGYDITNIYAPCQLTVDVILANPTDKPVFWTYNSFKAIDIQGYSYSPNISGARGDLYGEIPSKDVRRCRLSFNIPPIRQNFSLIYTDVDTKEQVNFTLDINARNNEIQQEQAALWAKEKEANKEKIAKEEAEQKQRELQRQQDEEQRQKDQQKAYQNLQNEEQRIQKELEAKAKADWDYQDKQKAIQATKEAEQKKIIQQMNQAADQYFKQQQQEQTQQAK